MDTRPQLPSGAFFSWGFPFKVNQRRKDVIFPMGRLPCVRQARKSRLVFECMLLGTPGGSRKGHHPFCASSPAWRRTLFVTSPWQSPWPNWNFKGSVLSGQSPCRGPSNYKFVANCFSVVQSRPFDLLVFPFWSIFSHGHKRLTF